MIDRFDGCWRVVRGPNWTICATLRDALREWYLERRHDKLCSRLCNGASCPTRLKLRTRG